MTCPEHYKPTIEGAPEPWDVFHELHMPYALAAALKYILRHEKKGSPEQDLQKALHCLRKAATLTTPFEPTLITPFEPTPSPCAQGFWQMLNGQYDLRFCESSLYCLFLSMGYAAYAWRSGGRHSYTIHLAEAKRHLAIYTAQRYPKQQKFREHLESAHAALTAALQACPADGLSVPHKALVHAATASSLLDEAALLTGGAEC